MDARERLARRIGNQGADGHRIRLGFQAFGEARDGVRGYLHPRLQEEEELALGRAHTDVERLDEPEVAGQPQHVDAGKLRVHSRAIVSRAAIYRDDLECLAAERSFERGERAPQRGGCVMRDNDHRHPQRRLAPLVLFHSSYFRTASTLSAGSSSTFSGACLSATLKFTGSLSVRTH